MMNANKAYEMATFVVENSKDWEYLEERIEWHTNHGHVQMFVSFDHNPQTAMHMLRELGYTVAPTNVDTDASYYGFTISWFPMR
jgi:hypothetical protein